MLLLMRYIIRKVFKLEKPKFFMGIELSPEEIGSINEKRVKANQEELYSALVKDPSSISKIHRLAEAYDVYDSFGREGSGGTFDRTRRERVSMLKQRGLLIKGEGVLLAQAAYRLIHEDKRYNQFLAERTNLKEARKKNHNEELARKSLDNAVENESIQEWLESSEIPSELSPYIDLDPRFLEPFNCH